MKNVIFGILVLVLILGAGFVAFKFLRKQRLANSYVNQSSNTSTVNTYNQTESSGNLSLTVDSPSDGQVISNSSVAVSGTTVPAAEVSVNDVDTNADANGKFTATVNLDEGENTISIVANDSNGNFVEKDINVTYTP